MTERAEFAHEEVNNPAYQDRQMGMVFDGGLSFSGFERDRVWVRDGDRYVDVSAVSGADDDNDGRALVLADFDDDGDLDSFVHDIQRERHRLFRNDAPEGTGRRSIKVRLRATRGAAEAAGAIVRVRVGARTTAQLLAYGSGFLSQNAPELVFGVAEAADGEVTVRWPGRDVEAFGRLAAGGTYLLVEGASKARTIERRPVRFADPPPDGLVLHVGDRLERLEVEEEDGGVRTIDVSSRTKPLLVNVWATYCAACVDELETLRTIADEGRCEVLLVGVDPPGQRAAARGVLAKHGLVVEAVYASDATFAGLILPQKLRLPTTLVVEEGRLSSVLQGKDELTRWWSERQRPDTR